jgi:hypothetical protein
MGVLAGMTKAPRGGARAQRTKLEPENRGTAEKLSTAQGTLALTVRALRELLHCTFPELRVKTFSMPRLNAVLVHEAQHHAQEADPDGEGGAHGEVRHGCPHRGPPQ